MQNVSKYVQSNGCKNVNMQGNPQKQSYMTMPASMTPSAITIQGCYPASYYITTFATPAIMRLNQAALHAQMNHINEVNEKENLGGFRRDDNQTEEISSANSKSQQADRNNAESSYARNGRESVAANDSQRAYNDSTAQTAQQQYASANRESANNDNNENNASQMSDRNDAQTGSSQIERQFANDNVSQNNDRNNAESSYAQNGRESVAANDSQRAYNDSTAQTAQQQYASVNRESANNNSNASQMTDRNAAQTGSSQAERQFASDNVSQNNDRNNVQSSYAQNGRESVRANDSQRAYNDSTAQQQYASVNRESANNDNASLMSDRNNVQTGYNQYDRETVNGQNAAARQYQNMSNANASRNTNESNANDSYKSGKYESQYERYNPQDSMLTEQDRAQYIYGDNFVRERATQTEGEKLVQQLKDSSVYSDNFQRQAQSAQNEKLSQQFKDNAVYSDKFTHENGSNSSMSAQTVNNNNVNAGRESAMVQSNPIKNELTLPKELVAALEKMVEGQTTPKTAEKAKVELTDQYVKNLESYLNSQDKKLRLMAAKDVVSRLQEDETRRENPALIALTNKMLQDPNMAVRSLSLAALESNIVAGDNFTTKLLTNMSKVKNSEEADIATKVLLRMPQ